MSDPELRATLTPTYTPGCKRLLQSNDYYPALQRPNVTVETEKIIEIRPTGIVTADGVLHEVDTIVYGTGFRITSNPMAAKVHGVDGRSLAERWSGTGMQAYCGTTIPGFPNYFMMAGPNTGIGHTSLVVMIEAQVAHVVGAMRALRDEGARVLDVRPEVFARWNAEVQRQGGADGVELGGLLELVSRPGRPQHHAVARLRLPLRAPDPPFPGRGLRPGVTRSPIEFRSATALVTGAGSGIGRATAHALGRQRGHGVVHRPGPGDGGGRRRPSAPSGRARGVWGDWAPIGPTGSTWPIGTKSMLWPQTL